MKKLVVLASVLSMAGSLLAGVIVPDLDDGTAKYNSTTAGTVGQSAATRANGMTLAAWVNPTAADITASGTGTVNIIEIGGTSNGSALMLKDGNYIFVTKSGANSAAPLLEDTDGSDNMIGITLGAAAAGSDAKLWVSFDGANGVIRYSVDDAVTEQAISNTTGTWNWHGNNTLSFGVIDASAGSRAGTADFSPYDTEPYPADNFSAFQSVAFDGTVTRGQYFNAVSTIPEPATLGLVAVFSGAALWIRRLMI